MRGVTDWVVSDCPFLYPSFKMTATDGLLEPKKAFSIREMKTHTNVQRETETACVVLGYVLNS